MELSNISQAVAKSFKLSNCRNKSNNNCMDKVLILDFGSQFTKLIARRIRELDVYSEIHPFDYDLEKIKADKEVKAIILSGGPSSVYDKDSPSLDKKLLELGLPLLGICYGLQVIGYNLGAKVEGADSREYGKAEISIIKQNSIFSCLDTTETVWMSHGDHLVTLPEGFECLASTDNCPLAAIGNSEKKIFGIQFHPEVAHTPKGTTVLKNFLFQIAGIKPEWTVSNFLETKVQEIREQVGEVRVLCALSGGVDSAVTAALINRAVGSKLQCVFVDHGLLRLNEREEVEQAFRESLGLNLQVVDASKTFLDLLAGVTDPEKKRKIIGKTFIEVFEKESLRLGDFDYLAQGTLYPDVIESSVAGKSAAHTIKSHHNVGGLPEKMNFKLLEPLKELFKDEVRELGRQLGLPAKIVQRHPFPGPGLAVRVIGQIDNQSLEILRKADNIFIQELKTTSNPETGKTLYEEVWQAFAVLTEVKSVGVMGDGRTYENLLGLRAVTASDGMTADWARLPYNFLEKVSNRIINEVKGVNRVVYDISSKPPSTIEWE